MQVLQQAMAIGTLEPGVPVPMSAPAEALVCSITGIGPIRRAVVEPPECTNINCGWVGEKWRQRRNAAGIEAAVRR
jgi:hypothetical protein